jgi:uncharacterized membrane protein
MVCSSPSEKPTEKIRTYGKLFEKIGVAEVIAAPEDRRKRFSDRVADGVTRFTGSMTFVYIQTQRKRENAEDSREASAFSLFLCVSA